MARDLLCAGNQCESPDRVNLLHVSVVRDDGGERKRSRCTKDGQTLFFSFFLCATTVTHNNSVPSPCSPFFFLSFFSSSKQNFLSHHPPPFHQQNTSLVSLVADWGRNSFLRLVNTQAFLSISKGKREREKSLVLWPSLVVS